MKNKPKNVNTPVIVILYLLAALFLAYGIYMAYDAIIYVQTYDTNDAVSTTNMMQYVVAASASYFGFAIVIFAAASVMGSLNKVQSNLYKALSVKTYYDDIQPEDEPYFAAQTEITAAPAVSAEPEDAEQAVHTEQIEETESAEEAEQAEASRQAEEAEQAETARQAEEAEEAEIARQAEEAKEAERIQRDEAAEQSEKVRQAEEAEQAEDVKHDEMTEYAKKTPETEPPQVPESAPAPIEPPADEVITQQAAAAAPLAEEFSAQFLSGSEAFPGIKNPPHQASIPKAADSKPVYSVASSPIPEEILQTKRKHGLKYETVSMESKVPKPEPPQNLSDTIRLKKEDRDAISSAFIRDIFESNQQS